MNNLQRLELITKIGYELQERMTYREIDAYLKGFDVDLSEEWSGPNSKRVYVEDRLAGESPATIIAIADELQIPHPYAATSVSAVVESNAWRPGYFRLFLSHISTFKGKIGQLQEILLKYGISGFVAHKDIEPAKEWQDEIEAALHTMDGLAAVLMPGFKESNWTDQEVGFAVCRGVLVVPIMRGLTPYGFIGKYQGVFAGDKTIGAVAEDIFRILIQNPQTRPKMLTALVELTASATNIEEAGQRLAILETVDAIPKGYLERLRESAAASKIFQDDPGCRNRLNALLATAGLPPVETQSESATGWVVDDIPF